MDWSVLELHRWASSWTRGLVGPLGPMASHVLMISLQSRCGRTWYVNWYVCKPTSSFVKWTKLLIMSLARMPVSRPNRLCSHMSIASFVTCIYTLTCLAENNVLTSVWCQDTAYHHYSQSLWTLVSITIINYNIDYSQMAGNRISIQALEMKRYYRCTPHSTGFNGEGILCPMPVSGAVYGSFINPRPGWSLGSDSPARGTGKVDITWPWREVIMSGLLFENNEHTIS